MTKEEDDTFATDIYNMVLSGLIALNFEQIIGNLARTGGSKTIFLGKWLKLAKKQRRFPKTIAEEIDNLLSGYVKKGTSSDLIGTFTEIFDEFQVCKIKLKEFDNSPKKRFDSVMSLLSKHQWMITLPLIHNYQLDGLYQPIHEKELFATENDWQGTFDKNDQLNKPLRLYVVSNPQEVVDCFYAHGFILAKVKSINDDKGNFHQLKLFPNNDYSGKAAIPSQVK
jgi:hypothetical protein